MKKVQCYKMAVIINITFPEIFYSIMVTSMVAPMIAPYGLNGCLQNDIYNYHNLFSRFR